MADRSSGRPARSAQLIDQVDGDVAVGQHDLGPVVAAADQGADAGQQLVEVERLAEVVVGPAVEAEHAERGPVAGRQEEHRGPPVPLAEPAEQRQAVLAGQPPVQQHEVPRAGPQPIPAGDPVGGVLDVIPLLAEAGQQVVRDVLLVLDDQDPCRHVSSPRRMVPAGRPRPILPFHHIRDAVDAKLEVERRGEFPARPRGGPARPVVVVRASSTAPDPPP